MEVLKEFDSSRLHRYPNANADEFCEAVAERFGISRNMVIAGNGSDDILTITFRAFTSEKLSMACLEPTYSLYKELIRMQNAKMQTIKLNTEDFSFPENFLEQAKGANLLIITRPNAPTGNSFPLEKIRKICEKFDGVVLIDEAYADFTSDNCMELAATMPNVIVSRTMSKSYSLAGLRFAYAVGHPELIKGLYKLKDSYNVDMVAQKVALAAFMDTEYLEKNVRAIKATRDKVAVALKAMNFKVIDSESNFLFVSPPDENGEYYFSALRKENIICRYFPGEVTGKYLRISIGTPEEMDEVLQITEKIYKKN
jgi:histidinol-phosphate aminotransferase